MKSRNLCYVGAATAALITVLCPQQALAQAGQSAAFSAKPEPETPLPIYGGEPTATCGWPTTVSMQGSCTGTLVHPRVVVYAAHCGADYPEIWFGEDIDAPTRVVPTSLCQTHPPPTLGAGQDIAFCVLAEPVEDIPIIPILMGCELDALVPGRKTALVGYGFTEDDVYGIKHEVTTIVEGFADNEILLGGDGNDACNGDSGGPGYFRLDPDTFPGGDGSWRVFGITSYGKSCGGSTYYSMIHTNIDWLEETAGIDVTPCHDRDGTWNPSALCGQVPLAPQDSVGTWNAGCGGGPVSDWLASCGEPFDGSDDMVPPITTVTAPGDGSVFEVDTPNATIYVRVDSEDPGGWGLKEHTLLIDGQELAVHSSQSPLEINQIQFPHGTFTLTSRATDYAGNSALSQPVTIVIGPPGSAESDSGATGSETDTDTTDSGTTSDSGASTTEVEPSDTAGPESTSEGGGTESSTGADDDGGCGCKAGSEGGRHWWVAWGVVLLGLRRRKSAGTSKTR